MTGETLQPGIWIVPGMDHLQARARLFGIRCVILLPTAPRAWTNSCSLVTMRISSQSYANSLPHLTQTTYMPVSWAARGRRSPHLTVRGNVVLRCVQPNNRSYSVSMNVWIADSIVLIAKLFHAENWYSLNVNDPLWVRMCARSRFRLSGNEMERATALAMF